MTKGFTGRLARGIHNRLIEELNRPGVEILPYPLQRMLVRNLAIPAERVGKAELLPTLGGTECEPCPGERYEDAVAEIDIRGLCCCRSGS